MQLLGGQPISFLFLLTFTVSGDQQDVFVSQPKSVGGRSNKEPRQENELVPLSLRFLPFDPPFQILSEKREIISDTCVDVYDDITDDQIKILEAQGLDYSCSLVELLCRCKAEPCNGNYDDTTQQQIEKLLAAKQNFTCTLNMSGLCRCEKYRRSIERLMNKEESRRINNSPHDLVEEFFSPKQDSLWENGNFVKIIESTGFEIGSSNLAASDRRKQVE